ncbi:hypothetical protein [Microcoleus sp. B9-D4]|uniref:hypothetical protein n=1 Tax=Microcoleus sp. B9-D4 TaxID=2818711 RepID=UPI002FD40BB2
MQYMWLAGSRQEVEEAIEALLANGFTFKQDDFEVIKNSPYGADRYSYTLLNFRPPAVPTPQPRPWDAVLGGKK